MKLLRQIAVSPHVLVFFMGILVLAAAPFVACADETPILQESTIAGLTLNNQKANNSIWFDVEKLAKEYQDPVNSFQSGLPTMADRTTIEGIEQTWVDNTLRAQVTVNYATFSSPLRAMNATNILACNMSLPAQKVGGGIIRPAVRKLDFGDVSYAIEGGSAGRAVVFCVGKNAFCVESYEAKQMDLFISKIMDKLKKK